MGRLLCVALLLVSGSAVLTGCGQTGQLYFDEDPPADQLPPSRRTPAKNVVPAPVVVDDAGQPQDKP